MTSKCLFKENKYEIIIYFSKNKYIYVFEIDKHSQLDVFAKQVAINVKQGTPCLIMISKNRVKFQN